MDAVLIFLTSFLEWILLHFSLLFGRDDYNLCFEFLLFCFRRTLWSGSFNVIRILDFSNSTLKFQSGKQFVRIKESMSELEQGEKKEDSYYSVPGVVLLRLIDEEIEQLHPKINNATLITASDLFQGLWKWRVNRMAGNSFKSWLLAPSS